MNDENADGEGEKTTDKDELNDTKLEKMTTVRIQKPNNI